MTLPLEPERRRADVEPVFRERTTSDSIGETLNGVQGGAELARLVRSRLAGMALMWLLALGWSRVQPVNLPLLDFSAAAAIAINLLTLVLLRRGTAARWLGTMNVIGDLAVTPAFLTATGGPLSPFNAVVIARSTGIALVIGRRPGIAYACGILTIACLWWTLAGSPFAEAFVAAAAVAGLTAIVLQGAEQPLRLYRERRKLLVSENRRLEEAIAELESQNRRLTALHALSQDIGTLGELPEVARRLRDALLRTFPGHQPSFLVYRRDASAFEPALLAPGADRARLASLAVPLAGALAAPPAYGPAGETLDPRAAKQLRVPLLLGEKPVGLLLLETTSLTALRDEDRALLATMANEMAVALRNADLHARSVELRDSMESLIENANALIFVVGPEGRVEVANRALTALVEPATPLVGRMASELAAGASTGELARALGLIRGGAPVESLPLTLKRGGEGEIRAVFSLAPVLGRDGTYRSAIAVGQDITRMEALEREMVQTEKLRSLGQFVAGIAHEMNNPLTAITAYGTFLRDAAAKGKEAPDAAGKLSDIVQAGERIQRFVHSLLSFSRPSKGETRAVSLNDAVSAAVRLCHYDLKTANVEVTAALAPDLSAIDGVEAELQQVFINLFTNAAHAMAPDGGTLTVTTSATPDGVRATVADTGRGIEPEALGRIWEPFYTTKAEGAGTGLGLSIVKRIVEQHRGRVSATSEPGKGTTFTLDFARG